MKNLLSEVEDTHQPKTFRKGSEASSRAERRYGYVILVSNEPRCCNAATSERRRIRLKADYIYIALRGASIRRSQRGNSEAIVGEVVRANRLYIANKLAGAPPKVVEQCRSIKSAPYFHIETTIPPFFDRALPRDCHVTT